MEISLTRLHLLMHVFSVYSMCFPLPCEAPWVTQMQTSYFLFSPSLPFIWGVKAYLCPHSPFLAPMASSLRRCLLLELGMTAQSILVFLIHCYQSSLPNNNPDPYLSQWKASKCPHWSRTCPFLGSHSRSEFPGVCLSLSLHIPRSSHTGQLSDLSTQWPFSPPMLFTVPFPKVLFCPSTFYPSFNSCSNPASSAKPFLIEESKLEAISLP